MTDKTERLAMRLAGLAGKLTAMLTWCVEHDGETLADNPHQLAVAKLLLQEARSIPPPPKRHRAG